MQNAPKKIALVVLSSLIRFPRQAPKLKSRRHLNRSSCFKATLIVTPNSPPSHHVDLYVGKASQK